MNDTKSADRWKTGVTLAVFALMVYALVVSRDHITHVAHFIGVPGWQAETAFVLIDLPAMIGKIMQLKKFTAGTHAHGRQMTYVSGSVSLACNIASGLILGSLGAAGWGAFVVCMFIYLESKLPKIKAAKGRTTNQAETPVAVPARPTLTVVKTSRRKCSTGCTCKRHNRAALKVAP